MKLFRHTVIAVCAFLACAALGGCSDDEGVDNREHDYGYVQFKLYKKASYEAAATAESRAIQPSLDFLNDAAKVKVTLEYGSTTISQTLILSAADKESAEFGLRSDKLQLLTGEYRVVTFMLYDVDDQPLYNGSSSEEPIKIVAGGLTSHDLLVNVNPRGSVQFTFRKANIDKTPSVRSANREYTFDEIATVGSLTVRNRTTNQSTTFTDLKVDFSIHFDENNDADQSFGYQTSTLQCDSLLSLPAGTYRVTAYQLLDSNKSLLEAASGDEVPLTEFTVEDNRTTQAQVGISLDLAAAYLRDYHALYEIWKALGGPAWSYSGEDHTAGCNWDFNKDLDLWGDQPGVQLHSNGRVARLDLSGFGIRGDMPEALGDLDQLIELYLGTHNDQNWLDYDPLSNDTNIAERKRNRLARHKEYLSLLHPATQMSEPCARALREKGISIPATSLYEKGYTEAEIFDPESGLQHRIRPQDMVYGQLCNGLKSLPETIGKLKNLEILNIANGELERLPDGFAGLEACTDLEIYNCPKMKEFPTVIARMPQLVSLNISNNRQWSESGTLVEGLRALALGNSSQTLQILYCTECELTEVPEEFNRLHKIGLLDLSSNKISKLHPLGSEVAPVQLYLSNNLIEAIPTDENGIYCTFNDAETVSIAGNRLTEFPNIFDAKSMFRISGIDLSRNEIAGFPADFKGVYVETLTLSSNKLTEFPKAFAESNSSVAYIILNGNQIAQFAEGAFDDWERSPNLMSLDLTYNKLTKMTPEFIATNLPYLYGLDISYNSISAFPFEPLNCSGLVVYAIRGQRDADGNRCLREWPKGLSQHSGLRGFYIGSNDLRKIDDTISYLIYRLDISDNPNIVFDASQICSYWKNGLYQLIYDKTQNITGCEAMLE